MTASVFERGVEQAPALPPYVISNPLGALSVDHLKIMAVGRRVETGAVGEVRISEGADFILRSLLARREEWLSESELANQIGSQDLTTEDRAAAITAARAELAAVTFGEEAQSIVMVDEEGDSAELRLHRNLKVVLVQPLADGKVVGPKKKQ